MASKSIDAIVEPYIAESKYALIEVPSCQITVRIIKKNVIFVYIFKYKIE